MKTNKPYDPFPQNPRYPETLDEVSLSNQLYSENYEEVLLGSDDNEDLYDDEPSLLERITPFFTSLRNRAKRGQWGKVLVLSSLLLAFSMLYSGDKKEKIDSSLLLPASAEEAKETREMTDEELEEARYKEALARKKAQKIQEDNEIVKSLQLLKEMKEREELIKQREEQLKIKEGQMKTIEEGVNNRISEMEKLKNELQELVTLRKDLGEKSIRQLVKVYENMQPNEAATVLERLEEDISVQVLLRMKGKKAGKILNVMKPAISVRLSEEIARRK